MLVETMMFSLVRGTDEARFCDADRALQAEFSGHRPGFLRRTTARGAQGDWLVVTLWRSEADADASRRRERECPAVRTFLAFVDPVSMSSGRYHTLD